MADETKPQDAAKPGADGAAAEPAGKKPKGKMFTLGLFGGVMIIEGVAIFFAMKSFGHEPHKVEAEEMHATSKPATEFQELEVANVRVPHVTGSRTTLYAMRVVALVKHDEIEAVTETFKAKKWTLTDTVTRVIRQAAESEISEPRLETLRRKMKFELNELCGAEHAIEQVLIPECMPLSTGL